MRHRLGMLAVVASLVASGALHGNGFGRVTVASSTPLTSRHHYSVSARVRPLLFWITANDIGDAVVTRRAEGDVAGQISLLIGSDPERAPRRINRWGYIDEETKGDQARVIGLMTEADEQSIEEAEARMGQASNDHRTYQIIEATINGERARSIVVPLSVPTSYSFRHVGPVLALTRAQAPQAKARDIQIPHGTRPGFLHALAELIHQHVRGLSAGEVQRRGPVVTYVYHGRLYRLRATRTEAVQAVRVGRASYEGAIASDFEILNDGTGEVTTFTMTYGRTGALAEMPLTASYQPRWWMALDLALDDSTTGPSFTDGFVPWPASAP